MALTPDEVIDQALAHYASPNYDPVKAHEYYIRNRKLKGRQSTKGFDQKQLEGLAYVRSQVAEKKKKQLETARMTEIHGVEQARQAAEAIRKDVATKLQAFRDLVTKANAEATARTDTAKAKADQIKTQLQSTIAALPPIPKGVPEATRKALAAQRSAMIKVLTGQADSNLKQLADTTNKASLSERTSLETTRQSVSSDATARLQKASSDLKAALAKQMATYKAAKLKIEAESKKTLDTEFQNIKTKVR